MNEAQRFLRYLTPGLAFIALVVFYLYLSLPAPIFSRSIGSLLKNQGIGAAATVILSSGAMGFLLSVVHHSLFWYGRYCGLIPNYWNLLDDAVRADYLEIHLRNNEGPVERLNPEGSWRVVTSL